MPKPAAAAWAGFLAAQLVAPASAGWSEEAALAALKGGGKVIVLRHAHSPAGQKGAVGMTEGCRLGEGRGLDALGFSQARTMGAFLAENDILLSAVYTSAMCRAWDTARLASAGVTAEVAPALMTDDQVAIGRFKAALAARLEEGCTKDGCGNALLASHSNVVPSLGAPPVEGEDETPEGALYVVDPKTWTAIGRIDFMVQTGDENPMTPRR